MAKTVCNIFCAQPIADEEIGTVTIEISVPLPEIDGKFIENEHRDRFTKEGAQLADALCNSLPRGTCDALLVELLERHRTILAIPHTYRKCRNYEPNCER